MNKLCFIWEICVVTLRDRVRNYVSREYLYNYVYN